MNVGGVNEVAPPGASKVPLSPGAALTAPGKGQGLGAFLSLLSELIEIPSSSSTEQPIQTSSRSYTKAVNTQSKNANNGEKSGGNRKKDQSNTPLASVPPTPEPVAVMVKPPLALHPPTPEAQTQSDQRLASQTQGEAEERGDVEAMALPVAGPSLAAAPRTPAPVPSSTGQAPKAEIAFGLRLISPNPQTESDTPAPLSDLQKLSVAEGKPSLPATPIGVAATPESEATAAEPARSDFERPAATLAEGSTRIAAPASAAPMSGASALSRELDRSDVRGSQIAQLGTQTEIGQASRSLPENLNRIPMANNNASSHIFASELDVVHQTIEVDELTVQRPVVRNVPQTEFGPSDREASPARSIEPEPAPDVGRRNLSSQSALPNGPSEPRELSYTRAQGVLREVSPQPTQAEKSQGESNSSQPTSKASAGETGPKQTMPVASKVDGEAKSSSLEPSLAAITTSRPPDAEAESSQAGDSQPATKVETGPEINAASQPQPARQISLKLTGPDSAKVDVELSEKGGKVQVAVRTADRELAKSLQGDLGDLVGRLETKGFKTEAWIPGASHVSHAAAASEPSSAGQGNREHSGSGGQQPGRQGRNGSNQRQQARWMAQLQESISTEETRSDNE